jgi:hypothetical protein
MYQSMQVPLNSAQYFEDGDLMTFETVLDADEELLDVIEVDTVVDTKLVATFVL